MRERVDPNIERFLWNPGDITSKPSRKPKPKKSSEEFAQARHPSGGSKGGQWKGTGAGKGGGAGGAVNRKEWESNLTDVERKGIDAWAQDGEPQYTNARRRLAGGSPESAGGTRSKELEITRGMGTVLSEGPGYTGDVHRGLRVVDSGTLVTGATIRVDAPSSWSRKRGVAMKFASRETGMGDKVVLHVKTTKMVDISGLVVGKFLREEAEVVSRPHSSYKIAKTIFNKSTGVLHVDLVEG